MYAALLIMFAGMVAGRLLRGRVNFSLSSYIMVVICLLLFVLGLELGFNEGLLAEFAHIGFSAIVIALLAVAGCCVAAKMFYNYMKGREER